MKPKFQQIYLEITNICNLSCPFCHQDQRTKAFMLIDDVKDYVLKTKKYTNSYYLHLKGEPLLHPQLDEILSFFDEQNINVKLTTNGYYLNIINDLLNKHHSLKRINVSLQSFVFLNEDEKQKYINNLQSFLSNTNKYVYLRNWINNKEVEDLLKMIYPKFQNIDGFLLDNKVYYSLGEEFIWPISEQEKKDATPCLGGKMQLGILVNGDVVLCCLDDEGKTKIGNLKLNNLEEILNSELYLKSIKEMPYFELCQKCSYRLRFKN